MRRNISVIQLSLLKTIKKLQNIYIYKYKYINKYIYIYMYIDREIDR